MEEVKVKDIQDDKNYQVDLVCGDCGHPLNQSHPMAGSKLKERWGQMVISSALCAGSCPKGCRATFSDCNINTKHKIHEVEIDESKPISI